MRDGDRQVELVVRADDDPRALDVPRGKQDWLDEPHAVWYPRTTGIWRSVFVEERGTTHVAAVEADGDPRSMTMALTVRLSGPLPAGLTARLLVVAEGPHHAGRVLVDDTVGVFRPDLLRTVTIGDGGIDDRWTLPWRPRSPQLLTVIVELQDASGVLVDRVESTAALRRFSVESGRFCVNGRPTMLRLVLDQGYWPETGATPPSVDALRIDLELARSLGFNGVRKHQKTEDPRFYALADRLGMLCWVEMPSAYRSGVTTSANLVREWTDIVEDHRSFASVAAWVPINESWGADDAASDPRRRALIASLCELTDALDGTRPVSANDGWETTGGDIIGLHDYDRDAARLERRYGTAAAVEALLATGRRTDGLLADLDRAPIGSRAVLLTEFGGVAMAADTDAREPLGRTGGSWGYDEVTSADELVARYASMWAVVNRSEILAGGCWTQLTDTYQEVNGLLTFDRRPKAPIDQLRSATRSDSVS